MHLTDIPASYENNLQDFQNNIKVSQKHTFTSREVSKIAQHSKGISEEIFRKFYLPNVDYAIHQAKESFSTDVRELIGTTNSDDAPKGQLGSNLPDLFDLLREF